jgi:hypothetical protein
MAGRMQMVSLKETPYARTKFQNRFPGKDNHTFSPRHPADPGADPVASMSI